METNSRLEKQQGARILQDMLLFATIIPSKKKKSRGLQLFSHKPYVEPADGEESCWTLCSTAAGLLGDWGEPANLSIAWLCRENKRKN